MEFEHSEKANKLREWLIGSARPNAAVLMYQIDGSAESRSEVD